MQQTGGKKCEEAQLVEINHVVLLRSRPRPFSLSFSRIPSSAAAEVHYQGRMKTARVTDFCTHSRFTLSFSSGDWEKNAHFFNSSRLEIIAFGYVFK